MLIDTKTNELFAADGYGNKRVSVWDPDTLKYKRHWGAYGKTPDDTQYGCVRSECSSRAAVSQSRALRGSFERRSAL